MHPAAFFRELREALPPDVLYSWDGGDFAHWGRAMLPAREARRLAAAGPARNHRLLAAECPGAAAGPSRDGAWRRSRAMARWASTSPRWIAPVRHKLPIVLIVGNDAGWGLERELQSFATGSARHGRVRAASVALRHGDAGFRRRRRDDRARGPGAARGGSRASRRECPTASMSRFAACGRRSPSGRSQGRSLPDRYLKPLGGSRKLGAADEESADAGEAAGADGLAVAPGFGQLAERPAWSATRNSGGSSSILPRLVHVLRARR